MDLGYLSVFGAGLLTFISPCVLPMVPIVAANYLLADGQSRFARVRATLLFSLGFLFTFILMGLSLPFVTNFFGAGVVSEKLKLLRKYLPKIEEATGCGLMILGVWRLSSYNYGDRVTAPGHACKRQ